MLTPESLNFPCTQSEIDQYREFHDGSGKKHVAAQLAGALAPHTPHFLGPRPHLARRGAAPWTAWCTFAGYSSSVPR